MKDNKTVKELLTEWNLNEAKFQKGDHVTFTKKVSSHGMRFSPGDIGKINDIEGNDYEVFFPNIIHYAWFSSDELTKTNKPLPKRGSGVDWSRAPKSFGVG